MYHQFKAAIYALTFIYASLAILLAIAFYKIDAMQDRLTIVDCHYHEMPLHCRSRLGPDYEVIYNPRTGALTGEYNP